MGKMTKSAACEKDRSAERSKRPHSPVLALCRYKPPVLRSASRFRGVTHHLKTRCAFTRAARWMHARIGIACFGCCAAAALSRIG